MFALAWLASSVVWYLCCLSLGESAVCQVEVALGGYSSCLCAEWGPADEYDGVAASLVPNHPKVWSDGSLVLDQVFFWGWVFCTSGW